jgi:hypothetical protein
MRNFYISTGNFRLNVVSVAGTLCQSCCCSAYCWKEATLKRINFWDVTPCSPVDDHRCFGGTHCLHLHFQELSQAINKEETCNKALLSACFLLLDFLTASFTLKMEAVRSFESSVILYSITRRHVSYDSNVHSYRWENCTCPPHTQINLVLLIWFDWVNLIKLFVFHYYFGSRLSDNAGDLIHVELWSHCVLTLVDQPSSSGLWACFARGLQPPSGTHVSGFGI